MRLEECPVRPALNAIGGYPILAAKPVILLRARAASPRHDRCQPLEPVSQKFTTPLAKIADPIYAPPKREDIVKNLLAAVDDVLACEEALFERLKGDEQIPPFEKPEPPKSEDFLEWQKPLPGHQVFTNPYHDSLSDNLNVQVEATARELEERRERLKAG